MIALAAAALATLAQTPSLPDAPDPHAQSTPVLAPRVQDLDVLPDGSLLVVHRDGVSQRLDAESGEPLGRFPAPPIVEAVRVHGASETLAWLGEDGVVRVVSLGGTRPAEWTEVSAFDVTHEDDRTPWRELDWTHDGQHLVTWRTAGYGRGADVGVRIWTRAGELLWEGPPALEVALHPTRDVIYAATAAGLLFGWPKGDAERRPSADRDSQGESREAKGDAERRPSADRDSQGESREAKGDAERRPSADRDSQGESREAKGDAERRPSADRDSQGESRDAGFHLIDPGDSITTLDVSPGGTHVVLGGSRPREAGKALRAPWVWVRDAETGAAVREADVRHIDGMQLKQFAQRVRYSPDGCWIGVGVGRGAAVGVIGATDLELVWTGGFRGGRMNAVFNVEWTVHGRLVSPWPRGWIVDPRAEQPIRELPWMLRADTVSPPGSGDIVGVGSTNTQDFVVRLDPTTGDVRWTLPRDLPAEVER